MGQQMRNKLVFSLMFLLSGVSVLRAGAPVMELIDVPTAEVLDRYGFDSTFRFYSGGGMLAKTHFGVFPRLNVGFSLDADGFVGDQAVDLHKPTLNVRFRFFDGQRNLPALALGYDGQGFLEARIRSDLRREEGAMRAIVTDEQRRSRTEAGLPSTLFRLAKARRSIKEGPGAFARRAASLVSYILPVCAFLAPCRPTKSPGQNSLTFPSFVA
jgi:hypothetical protein